MINSAIKIPISPQPDDTTCGPTSLHSLYRFYEDEVSLQEVIDEVPSLEGGGTLAALLGCHALKRGYQAKNYIFNLRLFDPTWFLSENTNLVEKLKQRRNFKNDRRLSFESQAYEEFLRLGGEVLFEDLTESLVASYLSNNVPILAGLCATYLYRCEREYGNPSVLDDIKGEPLGHFVILCGYDSKTREVLVADPLFPNPLSKTQLYSVGMERLLPSILLADSTRDANLLIIQKV